MFAFAMQLNYTLILGFFLASAVLAGAGGVRRSPKFINGVEKRNDLGTDCDVSLWAGATWRLGNETFFYVTGTFNVPHHMSGPQDSKTTIWVGIDGDTCESGILVGVACTITDDGPVYLAESLWLKNGVGVAVSEFSDVPISAGDHIKVTINLVNNTAGFGTVENLNKNLSSIMYLDIPYGTCGRNADWILQSGPHPLSNFTEVTFWDAEAGGQSNTTYGLIGANILEKQVDGENVTSVVVESGSHSPWMKIRYKGQVE